MDAAFLSAVGVALQVLRAPVVAERWDDQSVLEQMSVGMLACHLSRQVSHAARLLRVSEVDAAAPVLHEVDEHYRRAAWVTASTLDDPSVDRTDDLCEADEGAAEMLARLNRALAEVERLLEQGEAVDVVTIPWQGWSLCRSDFLLTRTLEVVVHLDDLTRSIDVTMPEIPRDAFLPVLHLLSRLASERHGQAAAISALARSERMPSTISAF